jgi:erythromycin esterase-like protein
MGTLTLPEAPLSALKDALYPILGEQNDWEPLLDLVGDRRFVLLGEASHGTHEFYKARAEITKRLILDKGFNVIALESDWPDALRVNRYISKFDSQDTSALGALSDYQRFPRWMWRNADFLDLVGWLKEHNEKHPVRKVGIYGLDLYSLHSSMAAVVQYLQKVDPAAAQAARRRYSCFEHFGDDPQAYGYSASQEPGVSCEGEVVAQLVDLQRQAFKYLSRDGEIAQDELFFAEQNARVAKGAEEYYRAMYRGRPNTWNLRDTHMAETLWALVEHLGRRTQDTKAVVWAHNSHLGDARHTEMSHRGELNLGQLVRNRQGRDAVLVGFSTFIGTVTAARDWDEPPVRMQVRPGMKGSYERLFHELECPKFLVIPREDEEVHALLSEERLERAIGVIYRPETERFSHYFTAKIAQQFDAIIHYDQTRAVEPLDLPRSWLHEEDVPETFPSGL